MSGAEGRARQGARTRIYTSFSKVDVILAVRPGRALAALQHDDHADDERNACARYTDDYSTALQSGIKAMFAMKGGTNKGADDNAGNCAGPQA